ncbi:MAG: right-handed parallel beta-helix repeat-containing protein [Methanobacteriaceae archaeon]|nr:right-handed parallel beta-helix repeat-containing protein [Methanobacteriaceae archaeon]
MNKQCLSIIMLFSFFVLISISGTVSAANLTVNPGGSIQAAVNNASSGDIITVNDNNGSAYTYTENVIINKKVSLQSKNGSNVTVQAANPTNPVFTINSGGSGTCISGFTIKNAANSTGILLNSVTNCTVHNNTIYGNNYGINIFDSSFNNITQNIVKQNNYGLYLTTQCISLEDFCGDEIEWYEEEDYYCFYEYSGIHSDSQGNLIKGNSFNMNTYGLYLKSDECWSDLSEYDNHVLENNIAGNNYGIFAEGVYVWSSEVAQVHFNRIENNILFGIYLNEIGVNATNNWWGSSNSPTISSNNNSDIRPYEDPCYYYSPWLVLGLNANPTNISGRESIITADLTHNSNGNDTSSQGHIPDGIPINFTTNLGTITSPIYTRNGKANSTFNRGLIPSGTATITATLDNQSVQASVIIIADTTQPVVTASLAGGIYNTTKSVTLTASDNLDPNPVIFYSSNNGTTWNSQTNTVTLNLTQGITNLKFYARDASNNTCLNQTITYTIDTTAPTVNANPTGNFYNTPQNVVLSATDNIDHNPVIYYTRDDSTPTTLSTIYTGPININTDTILKFIAVDDAGNQAAVQIQNYIFNFLIMNNNTVKTYSSIQAALDDPMTLNGHVIIVNNGTYIENIILNKNITIMSIQNGNVTLQALNSSKPIFTINSLGSGSTIQGFIITGANDSSAIYINSANNCIINNNELTNNKNGIYLHKSKYNIITGNKLNNHSNIGIYIYPNSDNNNINNNILAFFPYGIYIRNSFNNSITGNTLYNSTTYAIYLNNATNTLTKQNNLTNNNYSIVLSKAQNNTITENSVSKTTNYGIYLDSSSINTLNQNTINTSSSRGIYLTTNSNNNYIQNNILTLNPYGIYLLNSINNILTANIINNSTSYAIYISNATSTTTNQNNLTNNNRGIYLTNTQNNTITGNNLINNTKTGIYLNNSTNNILTDNTAKNSQYGLYIYTNSNNNQLQNNVLTSNQYGIYLYITENNIIKGNNV